ncbi:hypothetical protein [Companilactobacillus mishanensis]|uniref:hypothetical protein n=1 Tax=Companilactobacillus mishanensis TaxID=2486008 RepID=UPI001295EB39|nr:hypothetical protein [Companilactobacillus mishanensis]MQS90157.1 hypothetical protein [Companilactobacillus mishanensis]
MKKMRNVIVLLALGLIVGSGITSPAFAADDSNATGTETATETDDSSAAVKELFDDYVNKKINTGYDVDFGPATMMVNYGVPMSLDDLLSKNAKVQKYIFKSGIDQALKDRLSGVKFTVVASNYYSYGATTDIQSLLGMAGDASRFDTLHLLAYKGDTEIGDQIIDDYSTLEVSDANRYTVVNMKGVVTNGYATLPLINDETKSNRGVAPNSGWITDKYRIDNSTGKIQYRVSTHEWLPEESVTLSSNANSGFVLRNFQDVDSGVTINIMDYNHASVTLYKANGDIWNYTLPADSDWKITKVAYDQYGVCYYQVSNDAWLRQVEYGSHPYQADGSGVVITK